MRRARVLVNGVEAGVLEALENVTYQFSYNEHYKGAPVFVKEHERKIQ